MSRAADSIDSLGNRTADSIQEVTKSLKECLHIFREGVESFANRKDFDNIK
ncbi:MAG: hypothetical protein PVF58_15365 [Candidatus Methanofastidiosia archaeon]